MVNGIHQSRDASTRERRRMRATIGILLATCLLLAPLLAAPAGARQGSLATARIVHDEGGRVFEWDGASALHVEGACLPAPRACLGAETEDGRFFLPAAGSDGVVLVWWDAVDPTLRTLRVSVGASEKEGKSPLRFDIAGATPGELRVRVEPAAPVAGRHDQPVAWRATFRVNVPVESIALSGKSGYTTFTGCALVLCDDVTVQHSSDPLLAPWTVTGSLVADWPAREGAKRITIPGTGYTAEGEPPLAMLLNGLPPGEWSVRVEPGGIQMPLAQSWVRWEARLAQSP